MDYSTELKEYVRQHLPKKNDYSFIEHTELESIIDSLIALEDAYIESITPEGGGDINYDDDDAFDFISEAMTSKFPQFRMYIMAMTEDYLEVSEAFMTEKGEIEWE